VTLVDRSDRFTFKPLLYELLTGQLGAAQVAPPFSELLAGSGVRRVARLRPSALTRRL